MKHLIAILLLMAALIEMPLQANAQTTLDTNNPPSIEGGLREVLAAIKGSTNIIYEVHGLYAPALAKKYGGGLGVFYPISTYVFTGARVDWVNGGFWMPSGNAGLQVPITVFKWLKLTPFTYAGIGLPLSGATVGNVTIPGHTTDNSGQATAIFGYGAAIQIYSPKSAKWNIDLVGDRETWSGFAGYQYRIGLLFHKTF